MLAIFQFDAASASALERLLDAGRLPTLAGLRGRGVWHDLDAPATQFAAGAQYTLYSGVEIEDHGLFYPFQWKHEEQRVHYMHAFPAPPPVWEQMGPRGTRSLVIDPYESREPAQAPPGELVCGWQLLDRVVLQKWATPESTHRRLERRFGKPETVNEVFGQHTVKEMLGLRTRLLGAPARVADAFETLLQEPPYDLAWVTFNAAHVAGHQFWDLSQLDPNELDDSSSQQLGSTLDDVYSAVDTALGRLVAALPEGADLMVICPVGMEVNTSRADLLPEMLARILDPPSPEAAAATDDARGLGEQDTGGSGAIWRLRAALPSGLRGRIANALPAKVALDLTARLETRGMDWTTTRAFAHPAENQGYIRLNLRGRERDGIVTTDEAGPLMDEIAAGLATFHDFDGTPAVHSVERVADRFGSGSRADLLPDLIVRWSSKPATDLEGVRSDRFGTVRRHGVGSGRSGNHSEGDAWALVLPGASRHAEPTGTRRLEDIAATALLLGGGDPSTTVGQPLLLPA